jgi:hypothetical protein
MKRNLGTGLSIFVLLLVFTNCFNSFDTLLKLQKKFSKQIKSPVDDSLIVDVCEGNSLTPSFENKCTELTFAPKKYKKIKSVIFTVRQDIGNKFVCDNLKNVSGDLKQICLQAHTHFIMQNKSHKVIDQVLTDIKIKNVLNINNHNFSNKLKVLVLKINKDLHTFLNYLLDKNFSDRKSFQYLRYFDLIVIQAGKSKFLYRTGNRNFQYSLSSKAKMRILNSLRTLKKFHTTHLIFSRKSIKENFEKFKTVFKDMKVCNMGSPVCRKIMGFYAINFKNIRNFFSHYHPILDLSLSKSHKGYIKILFEEYKLWFKPCRKVSLKFRYNTLVKPKIVIAQRAEKKLIIGLKQSQIINKKLEKIKKRLIDLKFREDHHLTLPLSDINKKALNYMHRVKDLFNKIKKIEHTSYEIEKAEFIKKQAQINTKNSPIKFIPKGSLRSKTPKSVSTPEQNIKRHLNRIKQLVNTTYGNPLFIQMGSEKIAKVQDQETSASESKNEYDDLYYSNTDSFKNRDSYLENSVNERAKGNRIKYSNNLFNKSNVNLYSNSAEGDTYTPDENFERLE